jgi:hypothetical protein
MLSVCLYVCEFRPPLKFRIPEPVFMKPGIYIMASVPIWTAYFINTSHQSVCLGAYDARQLLGKNVTAAMNTRPTIEDLLDA